MKPAPLVSIIILNYNARKYLKACLSSVLSSKYDNKEVIFVDNASTDGSVELVVKNFGDKGIKIVQLDKNYGFSVGNNEGAKRARGEYIVFLNPDTEVHPNWLGSLVKVMEEDATIGIAQPLVLMMDKTRIDTAGCWINPYGLVFTLGHGDKYRNQFSGVYEIFYAKGCALMVRRDLWERLGGFSSLFFTYYEETDLCWRAWRLGYRVVCVPDSIIYHAGGGILRKVPFHVKYHEARGRVTILLRNHRMPMVLIYALIVVLLHMLNAVRFAIKGNLGAAWAIIKGTLWPVRNFRRIWASRRLFPHDDMALKAMIKHPLFSI